MNFLDLILQQRRQRPQPSGEQQQAWHELALRTDPPRGFAQALTQGPGPRIIAEFKRASPSKGPLGLELDPAQQALAYQEGGAVALSVLTEPDLFLGRPQDLQLARAATHLPVIRKDFLLEDWEIAQSRSWGADAVLLIAAALSPARLQRLLELSQQYGLDALVEVHTFEEADWVSRLNPPMIGINNRNLETFQVDLEVTRQLLPRLPQACVKVSESGFGTPQQLRDFPEIDAFLIGETLVRTSDPRECLRQLLGPEATGESRNRA